MRKDLDLNILKKEVNKLMNLTQFIFSNVDFVDKGVLNCVEYVWNVYNSIK